MKKLFNTFIFLSLLFSSIFITNNAKAQTTATLSFFPSNTSSPINNTPEIQIKISNAQNLAGFVVTVNYNPAVLSANSSPFTMGPFLSSSGGTVIPISPVVDSVNGKITIGGFIFGGQGASGEGVLGSLYFDTIATGNSSLTFSDITLGTADSPPLEHPYTLTTGNILVYTETSPSPTPTLQPTPSPSPSPSASASPSPSASASISPSSSPGSVLESVNLSIVFQGINPEPPQRQPLNVNVNIKQSGVFKAGGTQLFTPDSTNVYVMSGPLPIDNLTPGAYDFCFDAVGHLTKCFRNISLTEPITTLSFTNRETDVILGGDSQESTPEIVDIDDYRIFLLDYKGISVPSTSSADFDFDGDVDIYDYVFFVINFDKTGDQ